MRNDKCRLNHILVTIGVLVILTVSISLIYQHFQATQRESREQARQAVDESLSSIINLVSSINASSDHIVIEQGPSVIIDPRSRCLDGEAVYLLGSPLPYEEVIARYSNVLVEEMGWLHEGLDLAYRNWQEPVDPAHIYRIPRENISVHIYWQDSVGSEDSGEYETYYQIRYFYSASPRDCF